jgi:hypothetical protein
MRVGIRYCALACTAQFMPPPPRLHTIPATLRLTATPQTLPHLATAGYTVAGHWGRAAVRSGWHALYCAETAFSRNAVRKCQSCGRRVLVLWPEGPRSVTERRRVCVRCSNNHKSIVSSSKASSEKASPAKQLAGDAALEAAHAYSRPAVHCTYGRPIHAAIGYAIHRQS